MKSNIKTDHTNCQANRADIDHDRLFKDLICTFFLDFVDLFLPDVAGFLERDSITFLDKELFTDVTAGESHEVDLVVKGRFKGEETFFLIHIEAQSKSETGFARRMFRYFAGLYDKFDIPVYPVSIFSYTKPLRAEKNTHTVSFPGHTINHFWYHSIQLNRLNWRDFIDKQNPVAAALMSKMKITQKDRPRVKFECLRLLATLQLDPARMRLISGFVDMYLVLTASEMEQFNREFAETPVEIKESIMDIMTSWKAEGIMQGKAEGKAEGEFSMLIRLLSRKLGKIPASLIDAISSLNIHMLEDLGDAVFDINKCEDLEAWLYKNGRREA